MEEKTLRASLRDLPLGEIRYFPSLGSTNDEALAWAAQGAPDLSLVIADEQTSGRGREGRKWFTPPGSALAFSLLLRPTANETQYISRIVGLAALAVSDVLRSYSLNVEIKWPNDILVNGRKVAGILVESVWNGNEVDCSIIGIGLNVSSEAVPPQEMLAFPAISMEEALAGEAVPPREMVLHDILRALLAWRPRLTSDELISEWENQLAFRGSMVEVTRREGEPVRGLVSSLAPDGSLILQDAHGNPITVRFGDVRLRPAEA
jgi:BirA family biotin operon repressor/biotin-[acetyl-CoA-carboxylase] ligase